ncbi:hypothetical protein DFJ74DRAFT_723849 [Hyaloraphidium curvatum]|nr:hypothetical protein DFJ74DRAFT_723849 [Hyaloraphidium curvatum]
MSEAVAPEVPVAPAPEPTIEMTEQPVEVPEGPKRPHEAEEPEGAPAANGHPNGEEHKHKRAKKPVDFSKYAMNISGALDHRHDTRTFSSAMHSHVIALRGVGAHAEGLLKSLHVDKMHDFAQWKHWRVAHALLTLEAYEQEGKRPEQSHANVNKIVDHEHAHKSITEILNSPPSALKGISEEKDKVFAELHIKTVRDLGNYKYAIIANAIATLAEFEEHEDHSGGATPSKGA